MSAGTQLNRLNSPFDTGVIALTDVGNFVPVGSKIIAMGRKVTIHGKNGAAPLTDLQIASTSVHNGVLIPLATGTDLNANVVGIGPMRPAYPACLAADADWELLLDPNCSDIEVRAKGNGTSLRITGMIL